MTRSVAYWTLIAACVLSTAWTTGSFPSLSSAFETYLSDADSISKLERRFGRTTACLPAEGMITYVPGAAFNHDEKGVRFRVAQYTLAPRVISDDRPAEWVICDSCSRASVQWLAASRIVERYDLGSGLSVIRRDSR
ncbi:MAG: hypothetical protein AB1646_10310 [Thermodesulfobacteriota bacterium]